MLQPWLADDPMNELKLGLSRLQSRARRTASQSEVINESFWSETSALAVLLAGYYELGRET